MMFYRHEFISQKKYCSSHLGFLNEFIHCILKSLIKICNVLTSLSNDHNDQLECELYVPIHFASSAASTGFMTGGILAQKVGFLNSVKTSY